MVLQELGAQINTALGKLNSAVVDDEAIDAVLKEIAGALLKSDVNVRVVSELRDNIRRQCQSEAFSASGTNKTRFVRNAVFRELVSVLSPEKEPFKPKKGKANVFMFVGLQGAGKTTTVAKFANYWQKKGWKTAMVCCDTFRAGALDQIKQNAVKLHVPFYGDPLEADPVKLAKVGTKHFRDEKYEIILVDTSGRHRQESELFEEMEQVMDVVSPDEVIFVMDSTIGQSVKEQAEAFKQSVDVGSVIVTKLDGHAKGGGALSAVAATGAPITFIGTGEHFDQFEKFEASSFVSRLMGMGDVKGLMEKIKDQQHLIDDQDMVERLKKGEFTLRDFRKHLDMVLGMGDVGDTISMIPGLSQILQQNSGGAAHAQNTFKVFMTCFDSMTEDELDGIFRTREKDPKDSKRFRLVYEKELTESRIRRIARGAGVDMGVVYGLLQQYNMYSGMMSSLGKKGFAGRAGDQKFQNMMQRNPNQMMKHLTQAMDPRMLQMLGGRDNLQEMMKQMGGMEGMQDMMRKMGAGGGLGGMPKRR